jgi:hypothetical protein
VTWGTAGITRCRYGSSSLWVLHHELAGSGARRFAERVDLFFRAGEASLVLDLREAGLIDSAGADALTRGHEAHPGFRTVGRPRSWPDLPLGVRGALASLDPAPDLATALLGLAPLTRGTGDERRHHPRIGMHLPVAVLSAGRTAPAELRDISRSGVSLALLPEGWLELEGDSPEMALDIFGITADPLGRELCALFGTDPVAALAVRTAAAGELGARFTESSPPV